jgi:vacuolar protein sorting-associated protein 13A/C
MFEGILAAILNKYLSEYIDEVNYNKIKLSIFKGSVELNDIKIKKSALVI